MDDLLARSAIALAAEVRAGRVSAREVVDAYLARLALTEPAIHAYLAVDADGARAAAAAVDAAIARGDEPGPLAGVPLAVKDLIVTRGLATTAASRILDGWIPPYDATAVARLRAAGAIVVGKTNCDEFGMGSTNEASAFGPTANPWHLGRVAGGSSGGSAAALAAGSAALALGTDTGGSIRQPAALCGVVGMKPTYGRVSRWGAIAYASSLDQIGPMAMTVADAAVALAVIAGVDPRDPTSIDAPPPPLAPPTVGDLRGLRVGLAREYRPADLDPEVAGAVDRAAAALAAAGAELVEVGLPHTRYALPAYYVIAPAEAASNLARYDGIRFGPRPPADDLDQLYARARAVGFGPEVVRRIMIGTFVTRVDHRAAYYDQAQRARALVRDDFDRAFTEVDAILAPVAPHAAFARGELHTPLSMYLADVFTLACNLAGLPGLALPCGATVDGRPLGVQLLGRPLDEATLCRLGVALEAAVGPARRAPWPPPGGAP